jgi:hypothetical protein
MISSSYSMGHRFQTLPQTRPIRFGDAPEGLEDFNYPEDAVAAPVSSEPEPEKSDHSKLERKIKFYKRVTLVQLLAAIACFPASLGFGIANDSTKLRAPAEADFQKASNNFLAALGTSDPAHMSRIEQEALRSKVIGQFNRMQQRVITQNPNVALQQLRAQLEITIPVFTAAQVEGTDTIIAQANELLRSKPGADEALGLDTFLNSFNRWMGTVGKEKYGMNDETVSFIQNQVSQYRTRMPQALAERDAAVTFNNRAMILLLIGIPFFLITQLITRSKGDSMSRELILKKYAEFGHMD